MKEYLRYLSTVCFLACAVYGQHSKPPLSVAQPDSLCYAPKIAFYDGNALSEENGVSRLHAAYEVALTLPSTDERDPERLKAWYEKRLLLIFEPVLADVRSAILRLGESKGLTLVDRVPLEESGVLLAIDHRLDVTVELIRSLNQSEAKRGSRIKFAIGPARVGMVDTSRFPREWTANGVWSKPLWEYITEYLEAKKLGAALDSSRGSTGSLTGSNCKDITADFIESFTRRFSQNLDEQENR